jgi:hypothetical protein
VTRKGGLRAAVAAAGLIACSSALAAGPASSWTSWGNSPQRWGAAAAEPGTLSRGFVLPLGGEITSQVLSADGRFYAATSTGKVVAFDSHGLVLWTTSVGQLASPCPQLKGYGVTGTGVIDAARDTLYVADAFGRLHALALATGHERPGWPVQVYSDDEAELDWGALTLAAGSVYVPTGSYCDTPGTPGAVYRVNQTTRAVSRWLAVPLASGGGGGPWGWGGLAFDPAANTLFAATSGAFDGGSNSGTAFTEFAGYGDQLVQFDPDLTVDAASHPAGIPDRQDLDFVGSPVVLDRAGCGALVVAANKTNTIYGWRENAIGDGPMWTLQLQPNDPSDWMLTQLAWSPSLSSLYAVTGTELVRVAIGADCTPTIAWRAQLGTHTENGSPTVAGTTVWFVVNGKTTLAGYDARTGKRVFSTPLGGLAVTAPTIVDGQLLIGTATGLVDGFSFPGQTVRSTHGRLLASATARGDQNVGAVSRFGTQDEWESRSTGVYATENDGRSWHRIYPQPAEELLRLSKTAGVIVVGTDPGPCMCATHKLWTGDNGESWHETQAIGDDFTGSGNTIYWWNGGTLHAIVDFPPPFDSATPLRDRSHVTISLDDGTIVDTAQIPGGIAALVSSRVDGEGWDTDPRVLLVQGDSAQTVTLPTEDGQILVEQITASGTDLTVTGEDYGSAPVTTVTWTSNDGGDTWTAQP